jgi:hypothetical protein
MSIGAELAGVVGEKCGRGCEHHAPLRCERAAGHACVHRDEESAASCPRRAGHGTARVAGDMHAALVDGEPVLFSQVCCP